MASEQNDGGPAFPVNRTVVSPAGVEDARVYGTNEEGLSIRDYFAAKAMQAISLPCMEQDCAGPNVLLSTAAQAFRGASEANDEDGLPFLADYAYDIADAMLAARNAAKGGA